MGRSSEEVDRCVRRNWARRNRKSLERKAWVRIVTIDGGDGGSVSADGLKRLK